jgi:hypothetical protein
VSLWASGEVGPADGGQDGYKKDEKGNIIQRGAVGALGSSGFSLEKLLKMAEEMDKAQSASVRADLMAQDKLVSSKIEQIAVAQKEFFDQQKEHERLAEEREAKVAARAAESEKLAQQVQMQVGQIALSMKHERRRAGDRQRGRADYQRTDRAEADP